MSKPNLDYYIAAHKIASKEYSKKIADGKSGYLSSLEGNFKTSENAGEINLGIVEIPLRKIVGTYSQLRSLSFASNFMPLMKEDSEFATKWAFLANHHLKEGITDPIKVYEYLNYYYVIEGNKRVSVLKFFNAYSITANVIRIMPKKYENDLTNRIYYEFLDFNKKTGITSIWFSKEGRFEKLLRYIESFQVENKNIENKYKYFENVIYNTFRDIYHDLGGGEIKSITTGDAFLEYIQLYGIPNENNEKVVKDNLKNFLLEVENLSNREVNGIRTKPQSTGNSNMISTLTNLIMPHKKLKVVFVYAKTIDTSNWTYAHEIGRKHVQEVFKDTISTAYVENIPEDDTAYDYLIKLAEDKYDIIITTSPGHTTATLKAALRYTSIKFLNCSETHFYRHVSTYWGRVFEPSFLIGTIAGAMTKSNILGYVATYPVPEVMSAINSFALGARLVNPRVRVKVEWSQGCENANKWEDYIRKLDKLGADIFSKHDDEFTPSFLKDMGVDSILCTVNKNTLRPDKYLAASVWNWKAFYQQIFEDILSDSWKNLKDKLSNNPMSLKFWFGMDSGVLDFYYSKDLIPFDTQKLVKILKSMIISKGLNVFTGPIYDENCNLKADEGQVLTKEEIISMDWLVEAVDTEIPILDI